MAGVRTIDRQLLAGALYLSNAEARPRMASLMAKRARLPTVDFAGLLEDFALRIEAAERCGSPIVRMRSVPLTSPADDVFEIHGLRLPKKHPAMLYGLGDSLKPFVMAAVIGELELDGIRPLLVDWRLSAEDHRRRLALLYGSTRLPSGFFVIL